MSSKTINKTHDPELASWVQSANRKDCDFPIQNLPFSVFKRKGENEAFRGGVAIGDQVLDLAALKETKIFGGPEAEALDAAAQSSLNAFMSLGPSAWSRFRTTLSECLKTQSPHAALLESCLVPQDVAEYQVPANIGDYTDYYTSIYHATNIGRLFRPDNPLMPNYQWIPIGYHGRSSSIQISGTDFNRPRGQTRLPDQEKPEFGPSRRMDYELEVGIYIGSGNSLGDPIPIDNAENHVFGLCLFNDWSSRDIQAWEYQPLGPFLSKNFASTVSPWIVTLEALAPFRDAWSRPDDHPQPLEYLEAESNRESGGFDIQLEVLLESEKMRKNQESPTQLSLGNFNHSYWTVAQMVAHHTVNGCNLRAGDFFGSGTMSGPNPGSEAALIELTRGGKKPVLLDNGEQRTFLEDGDNIIMRAWCNNSSSVRIGFGELQSTLLPAIDHG